MSQRNWDIYLRAVEGGDRLSDLAREYGLSRTRIQQIVDGYECRRRYLTIRTCGGILRSLGGRP